MKLSSLPRLTQVLVGVVGASVLAASAAAQQAYATRQLNLRAGPDRGYPLVATVAPGYRVYVNGCLDDYRWCDVTAGASRGWAYSKFIEYPYQNRRLSIYDNGPTLALPIIPFILGSYWNDHYRSRPFYNRYDGWNQWRPGNRPPPNWQPQPPVYRADRPDRPHNEFRPQQPQQRPEVLERANPVRPQAQQPRGQPPQSFPQKQGPGASQPSGSQNL